jgi:hypothetical protein
MSTIALRNIDIEFLNFCKEKTGEFSASKAIIKMIKDLSSENERMSNELQRLIPIEHRYNELSDLVTQFYRLDCKIKEIVK